MSRPRKRALSPIKDPFLRDILRALDEVSLDGGQFERAMCELLVDVFPGLVPVSGGQDQGFDGALADGKGEPYPLICTTAADVEKNLRSSLDSYLQHEWCRKKAALVTSRSLTPPKRTKLRDIARERGVTLLQIFERDAVADRLARSERWSRDLLGVQFRVSPLTAIPRSRRPPLEIPLEGRGKDIEWLRSTPGDRILVGEPGSGKTFTLYHLVRREGWPALFLTDFAATDDAILLALREEQPKIVIVDDSHVHTDLLERLVHLRTRDLVPAFDLVAATWRGGEGRVLGSFSAASVRHLEPLSRDEIVRVIRSVGLSVGVDAMRFLVDQASNRPGLAVTLANLALQGGADRELIDGTALARELLALCDPKATQVLAGLSLGGDRGMNWEDVSEFLQFGRGETQQVLADLEAGGVLREVDPDRGLLAVWPRLLRSALLRTAFFSGEAKRLPFRDLFENVPSPQKAVEAILGAVESGGVIDREEIRGLVAAAGSIAAWNRLAALDEDHGQWVLENYRGDVRDIAAGALATVPAVAVRRILEQVDEDLQAGVQERSVQFPLSHWIEDLGASDPIRRREILTKEARDFLVRGGSPGLGLRAVLLALSPTMRGSTLDPGAGRTVSLRQGLLTAPLLERLSPLWALAKGAVKKIDAAAWGHLASASWDWAHPESAAMGSVDQTRKAILQALGQQVLTDLAQLATSSPGLSVGLARLATEMDIRLSVERDPTLDLLFSEPVGDRHERGRQKTSEGAKLDELAADWQAAGPREAARRFSFYRAEALRIGKIWNPNFGRLCGILASRVHPALPWLEALTDKEHEGAVVRPFLMAAVESREGGWESALSKCLDLPLLTRTALDVTLGITDLPEALLTKCLALIADNSHLLRTRGPGDEIPVSTLRALLCHPSAEVAVASAVGEWESEPQGSVRAEISNEWRQAMLRIVPSHAREIGYLEEAILRSDPPLAVAWLRALLGAQEEAKWLGEGSLATTVGRSLPLEEKMQMLRELDGNVEGAWDLAPALVNGEPDLYRFLLANPSGVLHLAPLGREPDESWAIFAAMAVNAGFSPAEVARASGPNATFFAGSRAAPYRERMEKLERFGGLLHQGLREVVRIVVESVRKDLRDAEKRDRKAELYGLGHTAS